MIKAICFDLDGVFFTKQSFKAFKNTIAELTSHPDLLDEVFHGSMMNDFKKNKITEDAYWDYVRNSLDISLANEEFSAIFENSYSIDQDIFDYILKIKEAGYKTCLCSNNFSTRIMALDKKFDFLKHFDVKVFSFDVGALKPDIKMFQTLAELSCVDGSEIVYSDDNKSKLEGAKNLGINTFVFENFPQFKNKLKSLGVCL
jgi:HAD superfamily hydrolase (TIGR01509 family)